MSPLRNPEILLVDGEPVAGLELPRHVVPPPFATRRVLGSDEPSMRASLDGNVVAAVVDGRADAVAALRAITTLRALNGGAELPIIVLVGSAASGGPLLGLPRVDVVSVPISLPAIHARLLLLAGPGGRTTGARVRTA